MNELKEIYTEKTFEEIKHINEFGEEYLSARELSKILEYTEWRNFLKVIRKGILSCINSGYRVEDHFVEVNKMVEIGSNTQRKLNEYKLSRYACYLIAQNGDARKKSNCSCSNLFCNSN